MGLVKSVLAFGMAITGFLGISMLFIEKAATTVAKFTTYGSLEFMAMALGLIIVYIMLE